MTEGSLQQVKAVLNAHQVGNRGDVARVNQQLNNANKLLKQSQDYLNQMQIKAPTDGIVNILSNFRSQGQFGQTPPPFKEGDNVWTGAQIVEIPDLSQMYIDLKLDEVDRGKIALGQSVKVRVDAILDKEFNADLDFISPAAALVFTGGRDQSGTSQKNFPRARPCRTSTPAFGRDERQRGDRHGAAAEPAPDPAAGQLRQERQARRLHSAGQGLRGA